MHFMHSRSDTTMTIDPRFPAVPGRREHLFAACLNRSTIDRGSLSRRSIVPIPHRGTSNIRVLTTFFPMYFMVLFCLSCRGRGRVNALGASEERSTLSEPVLISCMPVVFNTVDPRIPTRSTSGFRRPPSTNACTKSKSAVRCSGSRMKGELHLTNNRLPRTLKKKKKKTHKFQVVCPHSSRSQSGVQVSVHELAFVA